MYQSVVPSSSHLLGTVLRYCLRIFCAPKLYGHVCSSYMLINTVTFSATCVPSSYKIPRMILKQVLKWERIAVFYSGTMWHNSALQWHEKQSGRSWALKKSFGSWPIQLRWPSAGHVQGILRVEPQSKRPFLPSSCSSLSVRKQICIEYYPKILVRPYEFHPVLHQLFYDCSFFQNLLFQCTFFMCM